jgi:hypothetical protein
VSVYIGCGIVEDMTHSPVFSEKSGNIGHRQAILFKEK